MKDNNKSNSYPEKVKIIPELAKEIYTKTSYQNKDLVFAAIVQALIGSITVSMYLLPNMTVKLRSMVLITSRENACALEHHIW